MSSKALCSFYLFFKRNFWPNVEGEGKLMHVVAMSLVYYIYNHQPEFLKYRRFFTMVLGEE